MHFWHWLSLGVALILVEVIAPGIFLLWIGLAALATGLAAFLLPGLGWEAQSLTFAVLSVAAAALGRLVYRRLGLATGDPLLNRRGQSLVGSVHPLATAIVDGRGRLKVGDASWMVAGPDLPAGTRVRVVAAKGTLLEVEPEA